MSPRLSDRELRTGPSAVCEDPRAIRNRGNHACEASFQNPGKSDTCHVIRETIRFLPDLYESPDFGVQGCCLRVKIDWKGHAFRRPGVLHRPLAMSAYAVRDGPESPVCIKKTKHLQLRRPCFRIISYCSRHGLPDMDCQTWTECFARKNADRSPRRDTSVRDPAQRCVPTGRV